MKRTGFVQTSENSTATKRRAIIVVEYLVIAILACGTFYVVSLFTLFAKPAPSIQSQRPRVAETEPFDRIHSRVVKQATTGLNPWGIAFDSMRETVWVAEPGCEPKPTCPTTTPGTIGAFDLLDGSLKYEYQEQAGYTSPAFVAVDANGNVWFTEPNSNAIGKLDPQNMVWSQWKVQSGSAPFDLTFDKNGNLWFTEFNGNNIGFFNPHTQKLVENAIPTLASNPYGITKDPMGNIWFTENKFGVGQIGSFTPTASGTVTIVEHQVTTAQPHLITADKNGNLWFSEAFGGSIGEYKPASNSNLHYPISASICSHIAVCKTHISGISADSKGNIWFDDSQLGRVGYLIPTNGVVVAKTFSNKSNNAYDGLVVDNYNNVWISETYSFAVVMWPKGTVN
jgi:streptogramin lyase